MPAMPSHHKPEPVKKSTFTVTLPNAAVVTTKSAKPLTHVVAAINERSDARYFKEWRVLSWEISEARANKVASNKLKNDSFNDFSKVISIACARVVEQPKEGAAEHTCQLCGRPIHDNVINDLGQRILANHGYEIEGHSEIHTCTGSRNLAYEFSCDLLPHEIAMVRTQVERNERWLAAWAQEAPAQIQKWVTKKFGQPSEMITLDKPEAFSVDGENYVSKHGDYASEYRSLRRQHELIVLGQRDRLDWLEKRLAAWVAPVANAE